MKNTAYLHASIPTEEKRYRIDRKRLGGIERRNTYETGCLSLMRNVDTSTAYPYLKNAKKPKTYSHTVNGTIRGFSAYGGILYTVYRDATDSRLYMETYDPVGGTVKRNRISDVTSDGPVRRLVRFNVYDAPDDPIDGNYEQRMLVLPDFRQVPLSSNGDFLADNGNERPPATIGTLSGGRLFCAAGGKVYASDFNDVTRFSFDTGEESLSSNAWVSDTQSNVRADGNITAVAVYDGHPILFKDDCMIQVNNNKNPFRLTEIGPYGCLSQEAVCTVENKLAFVGKGGVMLYGGGYPRLISDPLAIADYTGALLASSNNLLYLYTPSDNGVWVYDTVSERWGQRVIGNIRYLCGDESGVYYIDATGTYAKMDMTSPGSFSFFTDITALGRQEHKRLCGIDVELILPASSYMTVYVRNAAGTNLVSFTVTGGGAKHHVRRFRGIPFTYIQVVFSGYGETSVGNLSLLYESKGEEL